MKYISKVTKSFKCLYGSFNLKEGEEVPMLIGIKFPEYVIKVKEESIPEIIQEVESQEENKNERKKGKQNEL